LPSRLDPLPNVAIDCLGAGLPMVCFDNASGIAEYLSIASLKKYCIAEYIDPASLAHKVVQISKNKHVKSALSKTFLKVFEKNFNFNVYIKNLIKLCKSASQIATFEKNDVDKIMRSNLFRTDYCYPSSNSPYHQRIEYFVPPKRSMVVQYVRSWRVKSLGLRKPFPGFNPNIYLDGHPNINNVDPLVDFIDKGRKPGPLLLISHNLLSQQGIRNIKEIQNVCLHIHAFHTDIFIEDIYPLIILNKTRPFLFLSTNSHKKKDILRSFELMAGFSQQNNNTNNELNKTKLQHT
jgi:hypothetical protein